MYGYDAETLKQVKSLPWGDAVTESTPGWQVWEHAGDFLEGFFVDGVWGTITSLGTLVGVHGWDEAGQAWKGLGMVVTGVAISSVPVVGSWYASARDDQLPSWLRESRTAMKETGKAFLAWDQWEENPARAGGTVTWNVFSTVFTAGAGGAVSGAGKAGMAAKAISFAGKAGRALDPTTYLLKGATASMSKIGDVLAGLRGMSNVDISLPPGAVKLPAGATVLPDGTLRLPDGADVPPGVIEVPRGTVRLPDGTPVPPGAIDFGDGMVRLSEGTPPPAGAVPVPEGTLKVTDGTIALPEGTAKLTDPNGNTVYLDPKGNLYDADGTLLQRAADAKKEQPPASAVGADTSRVDPPARQPALVGAGAVSSGGVLRLGDSLSDAGRTPEASSGPTAQAGDNRPDGGVAGNIPSNTLNHTPPAGSRPGEGTNQSDGNLGGDTLGPRGNTPELGGPDRPGSAASSGTGRNGDDVVRQRMPDDEAGEGIETEAVNNAAGDRPDTGEGGVTDKPDSDNPYDGQEPDYTRPNLLPADGPLTLRDVRNTRPHEERWKRGEELHRQMWGGDPERPYPVPTNNDPRYPVTRTGGRKVDVPVDLPDGRTVAVEVKTYGPYRTITLNDGSQKTIKNEVPLNKAIKEQIHKDISLRRIVPGYDPRWAFTHAGPSVELRAYLKKANIIFLEYGPAPKKDKWDKPRVK
ncbi:hypothetical protein BKD26_17685 [Streptomyces sp. CB03238]|nr:hypothetical protein BKD26_17685 [Streptomyces sp. CB03238]